MSFLVIVPTPAEKADFSARHSDVMPSQIVVSHELFQEAWQEICQHPETYISDGMKICKACSKPLEVLSYRD